MAISQERTHKCIYCLQHKPEEAFNTEHVVSRMMGRYDGNSLVLNHFEVCKDCNDYFSKELESRISLNSYEALSRIIYGQRLPKKERKIGGTRLSFVGETDAFRDMPLTAYTSTENDTVVELRPDSFIAVYDSLHSKQYRFYDLEEVPSIPFVDIKASKKSTHPICVHGYHLDDVITAFKKAGVNFSDLTSKSECFDDTFTVDGISVSAYGQTDLYTRRYAGKVLMNFLCCMYGKDFVLQPAFDSLRRFIREGTEIGSEYMFTRFSDRSVLLDFPGAVDRCHVVGAALTVYNGEAYLCGFVCWYNQIVYAFLLCRAQDNTGRRYPTRWIVCDNNTKRITTGAENDTIALEWPSGE